MRCRLPAKKSVDASGFASVSARAGSSDKHVTVRAARKQIAYPIVRKRRIPNAYSASGTPKVASSEASARQDDFVFSESLEPLGSRSPTHAVISGTCSGSCVQNVGNPYQNCERSAAPEVVIEHFPPDLRKARDNFTTLPIAILQQAAFA